MNLGEILAELERRRLAGAIGRPMPGAVNPRAFPGIMGLESAEAGHPAQLGPSLQQIINGAMVKNPNVRSPTPLGIIGRRG